MYNNMQQNYGGFVPNTNMMGNGFQQQPQQTQWSPYQNQAYAPRPVRKMTQPVTPELAKLIQQTGDELDIRISNTDKIKNWCTHKEPGIGRTCLIDNPDGTVTCRVCGETFKLSDNILADAEAARDLGTNAIQTIKTIYVDIPEDFLKSYSQVLSMLDMLPKIAKKAEKNFGLYENYNGGVFTGPMNGFNSFQAANNLLSGFNPLGGQPWGQPQYGYGYGYPQQPAQPQYGYYQQQPNTMGGYPQQPYQQPVAPQVDANGNVYAPNGPTTMSGQPMAPGFNPLVNNGQPTVPTMPNNGAIPMGGSTVPPAPAPTGPVGMNPNMTPATSDPQQTKQMTV